MQALQKCQADKVRNTIIGNIPLSEKIIMCHIIAWQYVEVKLIFPPDQIKDIIFYFGLKVSAIVAYDNKILKEVFC